MGKLFKIVFTVAVVFALALAFLPIRLIKRIPVDFTSTPLIKLRPALIPTETIHAPPPPPTMLNNPRPAWEKDLSKQRELKPVAVFGSNDAGRHRVRLKLLNYITAADSIIATVDVRARDVIIFSAQLEYLRRWHMTSGIASEMKSPVALDAYGGEIAALDKDGTLAWWDTGGTLKGHFRIKGMVHDLVMLPDGTFLVQQTSPTPYVARIYNRSGRELRRFAPVTAPDTLQARYLHLGYLAVNPAGAIALGFVHPYRLIFFNPQYIPTRQINLQPWFTINPPDFVYKENQIVTMVRQSVIYDVNWQGNKLYVLVSIGNAQAAAFMDVFDADGTLIQRYALAGNALKMDFIENDIVMLYYWPKYRIERLRISPIEW